jgi:hypothetical protein
MMATWQSKCRGLLGANHHGFAEWRADPERGNEADQLRMRGVCRFASLSSSSFLISWTNKRVRAFVTWSRLTAGLQPSPMRRVSMVTGPAKLVSSPLFPAEREPGCQAQQPPRNTRCHRGTASRTALRCWPRIPGAHRHVQSRSSRLLGPLRRPRSAHVDGNDLLEQCAGRRRHTLQADRENVSASRGNVAGLEQPFN